MDDIFTVGNAKVMGGFHNWLSSKWECDPVALLEQRQPLRFLGMEIHVGEDGASFEVSQKGFIQELLPTHGHKGSKSWSMGPRDQLLLTPEEEGNSLKRPLPDRVRLTLHSCAKPKGAWVSFCGSCPVVGQTSSTW